MTVLTVQTNPAPVSSAAPYFHDDANFPFGFRRPGSSRGVGFSTPIVVMDSDREIRKPTAPQMRYSVNLNDISPEDFQTLSRFVAARRGSTYGFRLRDWRDSSNHSDGVTDGSAPLDRVTIAAGDGVSTAFPLLKRYRDDFGYIVEREITRPVASTVRIWVDDGELANPAGFTVDQATGVVTTATAPADGARIDASFRYDVPVEFDEAVDEALSAVRASHDQDEPIRISMTEIPERRSLALNVGFGGYTDHGAFVFSAAVRPSDGYVQAYEALNGANDLRLWWPSGQPIGGPYLILINDGTTQPLNVSSFDGVAVGSIPPGEAAEVWWTGAWRLR